jgi:hypothetical protein
LGCLSFSDVLRKLFVIKLFYYVTIQKSYASSGSQSLLYWDRQVQRQFVSTQKYSMNRKKTNEGLSWNLMIPPTFTIFLSEKKIWRSMAAFTGKNILNFSVFCSRLMSQSNIHVPAVYATENLWVCIIFLICCSKNIEISYFLKHKSSSVTAWYRKLVMEYESLALSCIFIFWHNSKIENLEVFKRKLVCFLKLFSNKKYPEVNN